MRRWVLLLVIVVLTALPASARAVLVYQRAAPGTVGTAITGDIVVARNDGSHPHVVGHGTVPVVSPDGRTVVYIERHAHRPDVLRLVSSAGGRSRRLPPARVDRASLPVWAPDSRHLVVADYVPAGASVVDTRTLKTHFVRLTCIFGGASFAPDSHAVVIDDSCDNTDSLILVQTATGAQRRLIRNGSSPAWGHLGIAFAREAASDGSRTNPRLWLLRRPGRRPQRITPTAGGAFAPLAWSAKGHVLLTAEGNRSGHPRLVTFPSRAVRTLPTVLDAIDGLSRDGRLVLGETNTDVVSLSINGAATVLAHSARFASWSR